LRLKSKNISKSFRPFIKTDLIVPIIKFNNFIIKHFKTAKTKYYFTGFWIMEPFNIKISVGDQEITLTILPFHQNCYRVIYFGGILGAIKLHQADETWELLPHEEAIGDDLPPYTPNDDGNRIEITLDRKTIQKIGHEIVIYQPN
jgi:hypothetical protein